MYDKKFNGLSNKATHYFMNYSWPGNIRELENVLERASLLADDQQEIKLRHLFPEFNSSDSMHTLEHTSSMQEQQKISELFKADFSLEKYEQQIILHALHQSQHNVSEAARILGISRATLDYRLKKYRA